MNKSSFEEELEKHGSFTYRNKGISMMPLLRQGKDLFTVRKLENGERLKKYDVAFYIRGNDYVLHRVLKVTDTGYIIRGDNCTNKENIPEKNILGVMTEYVRDGKTYSVSDPVYKRYVKRMLFCSVFRIPWCRFKSKAVRTAKKCLGKH